MLLRNLPKTVALLASGVVAAFTTVSLCADETASAQPGEPTEITKPGKGVAPKPGPNDGRIAFFTAALMRERHYLRQPLNDEVSEKFFNRYFEELDPQKLVFTQEDINEFASYSTNLDNMTLNPQSRRGESDVTPAYKIFARYLERWEQRISFVTNQLQKAKFDFTTDERISVSRRDTPFPRDLAEAKDIWMQRLRYEYLQEKITRVVTPKTNSIAKSDKADAKPKSATEEPPEKKKSESEEIAEKLTKRYHSLFHYYKELESEDVLERYLSALTHVYDPHSDYMNSGGAANFAIGMNLALFGIGAELSSEDGYCVIKKLQPGPAAKSKQIMVEDKIIAVAQSNAAPVDVVDMNLPKVVQLIRGPKGSEVRLTIIPADAPTDRKIVTLIRDEIKLADQEAKAQIIEMPNAGGEPVRLGVIDLPSFYATVDVSGRKANDPNSERTTARSTTADVAQLLKKLKAEKVTGVILDLRRNGGGSLEEATALASLFIKGPVVQVRDSQDKRDVLEDRDTKVQYTGPLVVLTGRGSASAAEIVAGALQDYGRALIVGEISTFGKATVQNINPLRAWIDPGPSAIDPGLVKVTIRKYYRPSGNSTLFKGVLPDIVLPSIWNYSEDIGEAAVDVAMGNNYSKLGDAGSGITLGRDTIESVPFDKLDLVQSSLAELLQKSNARVATNQDFAYVREDIDIFRKAQADKTVSVNEKELLKEKNEAEARTGKRETERKARKELEQRVYEIKLAEVDSPGLPPAVPNLRRSLAWQNPEQFPLGGINAALGGPSEGSVTYHYTLNPVEPVTNWTFGTSAEFETALKKFLASDKKNQTLTVTATNDATKKAISFSGNSFATLSNSLAAAAAAEDKSLPGGDPWLDETRNILLDYIKLFGQKHLLSSKDQPSPNSAARPVN